MSDYANPNAAYAWIDGDAFRFPKGTKMPENPFASSFANGLAFGGIEAGFEFPTEQNVTKKQVFNYRQAAYKVLRKPLDEGVKFRAVDNSMATLLTRAQGGKITMVNGRPHLEKGEGEEFALLIRLSDGVDQIAFWFENGTLSAPPTRAALNGENLDGWDFTYTALAPVVEILPSTPGGMEKIKTITLPEATTGGTFTLSINSKTTDAIPATADGTQISEALATAEISGVYVIGEKGGPWTAFGADTITANGTTLTPSGTITVD